MAINPIYLHNTLKQYTFQDCIPITVAISFRAPKKTLIVAGRLNLSHLRLAKTLTARQAACVFCKPNLSEIHLVGRHVHFLKVPYR